MKIQYKLLVSFLALVMLLGGVGWFALRQNERIENKIEFIHTGSMQEVVFASQLSIAVHNVYGNLQELLEEALREKYLEGADREDTAEELAIADAKIKAALLAAEQNLNDLKAATESSIAIAGEDDEELELDEKEEIIKWHGRISSHFSVFREAALRLVGHIQRHELEIGAQLLESEIEDLFRTRLLPLVNAFYQDSLEELEEEKGDILATTLKIQNTMLSSVFIITCLALLISYVMTRQISRPIMRLSSAMDQIGQGEEVARYQYTATDEIGRLTTTFFDMVAYENEQRQALEDARSELELQNEQLETIIGTRTAELIDANRALKNEIQEHQATERQLNTSLEEKETLLKEIHHRVKNNLQIITSLLSLQRDQMDDKKQQRLLRESESRILSMAMVHEKLYQAESLAGIDLGDYIDSLGRYLLGTYASEKVSLKLDTQPLTVPLDIAIPCGLLLNELITNALKHAFDNGASGQLFIKMGRDSDGRVELLVADNGKGLAPNFDWSQAETLGMQLLQSLSQQLDASVAVESEKGTRIKLVFSW